MRIVGGQTQQQELGPAGDDRQEVVEVVRDAAGELADGLHLLDLAQLRLALPQSLLRALALGNIEHGRLDGRLALPEDLGDLDVDPDERTVAPDGLELVLRGHRLAAQAGRAVVFEARHVSRLDPAAGVEADELAGGAVAEHPCERRVDEPRDPVALDVDALDRALDQGAIAPLALALAREELSVPDGDAGLVGEP